MEPDSRAPRTEPPSAPEGWPAAIEGRLEELRAGRRWRRPLTFAARGPRGALGEEGREVVSFASNDYLGLSVHPSVVSAAHEALERFGAGAGASRLVTGSRPVHDELEARLAEWKGTEAAVCLPSGFATNLGVLSTFGGEGARLFSDELNHASIVDGCRLARATTAVYRHNDVDHLSWLLQEQHGPALVVTDSVFSMDGDVADVEGLLGLCRRHGALLVVDEAHAVLGPELPSTGDLGVTVLRVGTLSKTLGALGGFVAGPRPALELVVNAARPYIFTTALSPPDAAAAAAALGVLTSKEGERLLGRLRGHVRRVAPGHPTPIVPVVLGTEDAALEASERLLGRGVWVPAIRPPTVAPGTSRLRVTLSAAHTDEDVGMLLDGLDSIGAHRAIGAIGAGGGSGTTGGC